MNIWQSIVLGLVQGVTEFLPISSSGHLILVREWLSVSIAEPLAFDILLNTASLISVIYCFWGDIKGILHDLRTEGFSRRSKTLLLSLILGTIPVVIFGLAYGSEVEEVLRGSLMVAVALLVGSFIMFLADYLGPKLKEAGLSASKGFWVGCFQALALIPGISRSGSTISGGLLVGLSREEAIRFSFLLFIPASVGALAKVIFDTESLGANFALDLNYLIAFVVALFSGIWAIRFLLRYLKTHSFKIFIIYRLILAGVILIFL